jgi:hypothetical protein
MLPASLEWHVAALLLAVAIPYVRFAAVGVAAMLVLSWLIAAVQAAQARIAGPYDSLRTRLLVMTLCYAQPLVRSWARYRTRFFAYRAPRVRADRPPPTAACALPLSGRRVNSYWSEDGFDRLQLISCAIQDFTENRWGRTIDSGWADWDVEVYCHPWTVVQIATAEEEHAAGKKLVLVRYKLRPSRYLKSLLAFTVIGGVAGAGWLAWFDAAACTALLLLAAALWWRGTRRAALAVAVIDRWAVDMGMTRMDPASEAVCEKGSGP